MSIQDRKLEMNFYEEEVGVSFSQGERQASSSEATLDLTVFIGILAHAMHQIKAAQEASLTQTKDVFQLIQAQKSLISSEELLQSKEGLRTALMDLQNLSGLYAECSALLSKVITVQCAERQVSASCMNGLYNDLELKVSSYQLSLSPKSERLPGADILSTVTEHVAACVESGVNELRVIISKTFLHLDALAEGELSQNFYLLYLVQGTHAALDILLEDL